MKKVIFLDLKFIMLMKNGQKSAKNRPPMSFSIKIGNSSLFSVIFSTLSITYRQSETDDRSINRLTDEKLIDFCSSNLPDLRRLI